MMLPKSSSTNPSPIEIAAIPSARKARSARRRPRNLRAAAGERCGERRPGRGGGRSSEGRSSIGASSLGCTCSLITFSVFAHEGDGDHVQRERHREQDQPEGEGGECLGTVKLLIADQQRD